MHVPSSSSGWVHSQYVRTYTNIRTHTVCTYICMCYVLPLLTYVRRYIMVLDELHYFNVFARPYWEERVYTLLLQE